MSQRSARNEIFIYTDGASSGNPGPGGWGAILLAPAKNRVKEMGGGEAHTTNNRMELTAILRALEACKSSTYPIQVYSDSKYAIQGASEWIWNWTKRNWVSAGGSPVLNADLWQKILPYLQKLKIQWHYVPGHSGDPGNERADEIAVSFSKKKTPNLYEGALSHYEIPILREL